MNTLECVSKKPSKPDAPKARASSVQVSLRKHFIEPSETMVKRLGFANLSEYVNFAVREHLQREGLWPPKENK